MTATEELRRLLDERGVEWAGRLHNETVVKTDTLDLLYATFPHWGVRACICNFLTPAQAIDATLGRGECHTDQTEAIECVCDGIGRYGKRITVRVMECSECGGTYEQVNGAYEFCPRCGAKVVDA